ncbi:MAG: ABC transporter ATP-binding protein/permease [Clostridia bacterium]|nr:ABC transporter ATP-binding protein/permease [Clostridia bacterium]
MLELKNITKDYPAGDGVVKALKGISLRFRKSDFVSILGPSGCGKTTMLNIIGGLDRYTTGDLVINSRSTKDFRDRDWDAYRNHSIGFVFQSYNLIPHQSVLQNVELALTLSGVSKAERKKRAKQALCDVGLDGQFSKKPNQLSGGQMQRVAIARALVNNPDIILADEPTGALDSETSEQVMKLLKEIASDRLVIMVTHNPEIADKYSTRIIRMLDGEITDDTNPVTDEEYERELSHIKENVVNTKKEKKPSMSFATSFMLSLKNLFTKKARTTLTAFAGSIGIIGIALILAISQGMTTYVNETQENALSSYPLTIEKTTVDLSSLMNAFMNVDHDDIKHEKDAVYKKSAIYNMMNAMNNLETRENDLKKFKAHLEAEMKNTEGEKLLSDMVNGINYTYDLPLLVYTKNADGSIIASDSSEIMAELIYEHVGVNMLEMLSINPMMSASSSQASLTPKTWQEMLAGNDGAYINDLLYSQYDLIDGEWPNSYDEIVLVLDKNNELDDLTLYSLGLLSEETINDLMASAMQGKEIEIDKTSFSYEEIRAKEYRVILNSSCFSYNEETGLYTDLRSTDAGMKYLYDNALKLKVSGIIRPKEDISAYMLTGAIGYTRALTEHVIEESKKSDAIASQMENTYINLIDGLPFRENTSNLTDAQKDSELRKYLSGLSQKDKASAYISIMSIPSKETLEGAVAGAKAGKTREDLEKTVALVLASQMNMSEEEVSAYVSDMSEKDLHDIFDKLVIEQTKMEYAKTVKAQLSQMGEIQLSMALDMALPTYTEQQCATYYDEIMKFSDLSYEDALLTLGYVDIASPSTVNIYASSFENKDYIEDFIKKYNKGLDEMEQIKYTDYVGIMMSSVTTIINAITYVLIAFVAISLVVSSIMIGVITLISVQERTKEIGILRAIGASKKNVSRMFNAETMIIGFTSGALGVGVTYILCIITNIILHSLTGIQNLNAYLPFSAALILIAISVLLTLISGIIPSRSASKKDPVVALRTE